MPTFTSAPSPSPGADDARVLEKHLPAGEAVLWVGRPLPRHAAWSGVPGSRHAARVAFVMAGALAVVPFVVAGVYICWVAAARFFDFERMDVVLGAPLLFTFGFVVAIAPAYLLLRPRLHHLQLARETWYALTPSHARVFLLRGGEVVDATAVALSCMQGAQVRFHRADGSGDVLLYPTPGAAAAGVTELAFVAVADAAAVQARVSDGIAACREDLATT